MEGVPRIPMLSFPMKRSADTPNFKQRLRSFIAGQYNENPDSYSGEINELEALRASAVHVSKDFTGCATLKKYFCQLNFLKSRFPLHEGSPIAVTFSWYDVYSDQVHGWSDIDFEMSCILFNIGALHTELGSHEKRQNADEMKSACTHFQCAAWAFHHLRNNYQKFFTPDISPDVLSIMTNVCLGQAQECILEKSLIDNRKSTIQAKVALYIVEYYQLSLKSADQLLKDANQYAEKTIKAVKKWKRLIELKVAYYSAVTHLFRGLQSEEDKKWGERITFYKAATEKLEVAIKLARNMDKGDPSVNETLTFANDVIVGKLAVSERENEFIYHDRVPELNAIVGDLKGISLVKGVPIKLDDSDISGPDIFGRLVPMEAHEASSLYSEEKAKLLRTYSSKIEDKNQLLDKFLIAIQLDQLDLHTNEMKVPQELVNCCAALTADQNILKKLSELMTELSGLYHDVDSSLEEVQSLLKEQETKESEYQSLMGKRPPNNLLTELSREGQKYQTANKAASESNQQLHEAMKRHMSNIQILMKPFPEVLKHIPSAADAGVKDESAILEMQRLSGKVEEMRKQREMLESQLREAIQNDDITKQLVVKKDEDQGEVFREELKKFDKVTQVIEQNLLAQENIIRALTEANANYAETRKATSQIIQKRNEVIQSLISSYEAYDELMVKCNKGIDFYRKLNENVVKLLQRTRSVCKVQDEERESAMKSLMKKLPSQPPNFSNISNIPTSSNIANITNQYGVPPERGPLRLKDYLDSRKTPTAPTSQSQVALPQSQVYSYPQNQPVTANQPQIPSSYTSHPQQAISYNFLPNQNKQSSVSIATQQPYQNIAPNVSTATQQSYQNIAPNVSTATQQPYQNITPNSTQQGYYNDQRTQQYYQNYPQQYQSPQQIQPQIPSSYTSQPQQAFSYNFLPNQNKQSSVSTATQQPYQNIAPNVSTATQQPYQNIAPNVSTATQQPYQNITPNSNQHGYYNDQRTQQYYQNYSQQYQSPQQIQPQIPSSYTSQPQQAFNYNSLPNQSKQNSVSTATQQPYQNITPNVSTATQQPYQNITPNVSTAAQQPYQNITPNVSTAAQQSYQNITPNVSTAAQQPYQNITPNSNQQGYYYDQRTQQYYQNYPQQYQPPQQQQLQPQAPSATPAIKNTAKPATNFDLLSDIDLYATSHSIQPLAPVSSKGQDIAPGNSTAATESASNVDSTSPQGNPQMKDARTPSPTMPNPIVSTAEDNSCNSSPVKANSKKTKLDPLSDANTLQKFALEVEKLSNLIESFHKKSLNGPTNLDLKWKDLIDIQNAGCIKKSISVARCYPMKNRFPDILPFDQTRVPLPSTKDDYINGSYMRELSPSALSFIVTQAPMPSTFEDFWHMIWSENVELIVCLANESDLKGHIYWPEVKGKELTFGPFKIVLQTRNAKQYYLERIVSITHRDLKQTRVVIHLQFSEWAGNVFPANPSQLLAFVNEVHSFHEQQRNLSRPVVVHCIPGVGKSGVFCILSSAIQEINDGKGIVDLTTCGGAASCQRKGIMIDKEYLRFAYHCLLYYCQDLLLKRGILSARLTFDDKKTKTHTRHPSQDFLQDQLKKTRSEMGSDPDQKATFGNSNDGNVDSDSPSHRLENKKCDSNFGSQASSRKSSISSIHSPKFTSKLYADMPANLTNIDPVTFNSSLKSKEEHNIKELSREAFESGKGALLDRKIEDTSDPLSSLDPLWTIKK